MKSIWIKYLNIIDSLDLRLMYSQEMQIQQIRTRAKDRYVLHAKIALVLRELCLHR